jgi:hypothetical protein
MRPWDKRSIELEPEHGVYADFTAFEEWMGGRDDEFSPIWDDMDIFGRIGLYGRMCNVGDPVEARS